MLLEREPELTRLQEVIGAARAGAGNLVIIQGPAGIGKTALLRAARRMAEDARMTVLRARASDLEHEFAFGVVRQLFEAPLLRAESTQRAALLHGAAALASPLFQPARAAERDGTGTGGPSSARGQSAADRRFTLVHSLYWLTANLADTGPLTITVDDAQWADIPSLRFLAYLSARCEELGVVIIVTVRDGEPAPTDELLTALRNETHAILIEPASLSEAAVATLVRAALGAHADAGFCVACARASAGNPFLLRELITELESECIEPVATSAVRVDGVHPDSVSRAMVARLGRLGAEARNLARAVAVLESATVRQAAAVAEMDDQRARQAADQLIAAQILGPWSTVAFVHPLLQRAVYERIPAAARADGHRRAGLLLASEGERSTRVGAHLLRGDPAGDLSVVALLRDAAQEALLDGAPQTAVRFLCRALSEPPPATLRGVVLGELGEAEALARDPSAVEHLREALASVAEPATRVRLACALAELLVWDGRAVEAHEILTRTIDELGSSGDPALLAGAETVRAATASVDKRLVDQVEPRLPRLRELAVAAGPAGRGLLIFEACWKAQSGPHSGDWRALLDAGLDRGRFVAEEPAGSQLVRYAAAVLVLADEVGRARALIADVRADALARGSIDGHLTALTWGSLLALRLGELRHAEEDARTALELAERHEVLWAQIWANAFLAEALLERGAVGAAERALQGAPIEQVLGSAAALHALLARGRVRLAQGRPAEAIADLRAAGEGVIIDNPSYVPWRSTLALAVAAADPAQARSLAETELARAQELGQARGAGVALRTCGLLAGGATGIARLSEAVDTLRGSPAKLELARALYDLGAAQRRAGQRSAAREPLREALALASWSGAESLAQRAREELLATGAHPRREQLSGPDALTPSERRVAELAAAGRTNREIAQALFVTTKTVGTHLGHIYQKLDLQGPQARDGIGERLEGAPALP